MHSTRRKKQNESIRLAKLELLPGQPSGQQGARTAHHELEDERQAKGEDLEQILRLVEFHDVVRVLVGDVLLLEEIVSRPKVGLKKDAARAAGQEYDRGPLQQRRRRRRGRRREAAGERRRRRASAGQKSREHVVGSDDA